MCTLTWIRRDSGFELFFNRDEKRSRGRALSPRIHERTGRRWIAPVDADGGGTWIGVNEFGLALALLNGFRDGDEAERPWTSRGLLVDSLLDALSRREVEVRLRKRDLSRYRSFSLIALDPASTAMVATWDGAELALDHRDEGHPPICSSSRDTNEATRVRRALFQDMVAEHGSLDPDLLERFHASHRPERGAWSPCMHRESAQTRSSTRIRVDARGVELHYTPGAPCEGHPAELVDLARSSRAVLHT